MEEALIKRVLPHSIEAEQSVVGQRGYSDSVRDHYRAGFLSNFIWCDL